MYSMFTLHIARTESGEHPFITIGCNTKPTNTKPTIIETTNLQTKMKPTAIALIPLASSRLASAAELVLRRPNVSDL